MPKQKFARIENMCQLCSTMIAAGAEIWPVPGAICPVKAKNKMAQGAKPADLLGWTHIRCAKKYFGQLETQGLDGSCSALNIGGADPYDYVVLVPPTCPYWMKKGKCSFGSDCFYSHPALSSGSASGSNMTTDKTHESDVGCATRLLLKETGMASGIGGIGRKRSRNKRVAKAGPCPFVKHKRYLSVAVLFNV